MSHEIFCEYQAAEQAIRGQSYFRSVHRSVRRPGAPVFSYRSVCLNERPTPQMQREIPLEANSLEREGRERRTRADMAGRTAHVATRLGSGTRGSQCGME